MNKEYEPEVLQKLWKVEEGIYLEFARICDKYNLRYFCAYRYYKYSPSQNVDRLSRNVNKLSHNVDKNPAPNPYIP